jgi:hypothetical protein
VSTQHYELDSTLWPSWTVRVLDNVEGSGNYALNWIGRALLPETFVKRSMKGLMQDHIVQTSFVEPHSFRMEVFGLMLESF